jgi:hypothetical protein
MTGRSLRESCKKSTVKASSFSIQTLSRDLTIPFDVDVPSLTLRSSPGQGMHVHIQKSKRDQGKLSVSGHFVKIAESGSTSSFFYQASEYAPCPCRVSDSVAF